MCMKLLQLMLSEINILSKREKDDLVSQIENLGTAFTIRLIELAKKKDDYSEISLLILSKIFSISSS